MTAYYVSTTGNDGNAGTSAAAAFATVKKASQSAASGDVVYVGAGTFAEGDNVSTFVAGVRVQGSGQSRTIITSTALLLQKGCILCASEILDLTVNGVATNQAGTYNPQAPVGWSEAASTPQTTLPKMECWRCNFFAHSDSGYFSDRGVATDSTVLFHNCTFTSAFDTLRTLQQNTWNIRIYAFDCTFTVTGPNYGPSHTYRGIAVSAGTVNCFGCTVSVTDNDASSAFLYGVYNDADTANVYLNDTSITTATSGTPDRFDLNNLAAGALVARKCSYSTSQGATVDGVGLGPTIKTVGSGGDYADLTAALAAMTQTNTVVYEMKAGTTAAPATVELATLTCSRLIVRNAAGAGANLLIQADNAGQAIITGTLTFLDSTGGAGPASVDIYGIQFGTAAGTRGRATVTAGGNSGVSGALCVYGSIYNCLFRNAQSQSSGIQILASLSANNGGTAEGYNCAFTTTVAPTGGTLRAAQLTNSSGISNVNFFQNSVWADNNTASVTYNYSGTLTMSVANNIVVGSTIAKVGFTAGTASGTLITNASTSGNRTSDSTALGTDDKITGLVQTDVWRSIAGGFAIVPNSNTLNTIGMTSSPTDGAGYARPQSGGQVYAGALAARPIAPTNPAGTPGDASASLSWTASADAITYKVQQDGVQVASGIAGTSRSITSLTNGHAYSFTVTSVDGSGNEGPISSAVIVTPAARVASSPLAPCPAAANRQFNPVLAPAS